MARERDARVDAALALAWSRAAPPVGLPRAGAARLPAPPGLAAAVAVGCVLPGILAPSVVQHGLQRGRDMADAAATLRAIRDLPLGAVVVTRHRLPMLAAMAAVSPPTSRDPMGLDGRVTLPGGQVLAYNYGARDARAPAVYRLTGLTRVPERLPELEPWVPQASARTMPFRHRETSARHARQEMAEFQA